MDNSFYFERLSEEFFKDFIELFVASFRIKLTLNEVRKKFSTGYTGCNHLGYLAIDKSSGKAAAYYGVIPLMACYAGEKILCAQSGDTMTHPQFRGKGLFINLAQKTYELCKESGVRFVFGFPNKNSYPGFVRKLNWIHYADMHQYVLNSGFVFPVEKVVKKLHLTRNFNTLFLEPRFICRENCYFENSLSSEGNYEGYLIHDLHFYQYKSFQKFYFNELSSGTKICFKVDGRLWIGDLSSWNPETLEKDIHEIKKLAGKYMIKYIHFNVQKNTLADTLLSGITSPRNAFPLGGINFSDRYDVARMAFTSLDYDTF